MNPISMAKRILCRKGWKWQWSRYHDWNGYPFGCLYKAWDGHWKKQALVWKGALMIILFPSFLVQMLDCVGLVWIGMDWGLSGLSLQSHLFRPRRLWTGSPRHPWRVRSRHCRFLDLKCWAKGPQRWISFPKLLYLRKKEKIDVIMDESIINPRTQ